MATARISLDSPVFAGRLRSFDRRSTYERRALPSVNSRLIGDVRTKTPRPKPAPPRAALPKSVKTLHPLASAAKSAAVPPARTSRSLVLKRQLVRPPSARRRSAGIVRSLRGSSLHKRFTLALAAILFALGAYVGIDGLRANQQVEAQVKNLQTTQGNNSQDNPAASGDVPAEDDKPDINAYRVAGNLPRVITIPKLDVKARVMHLGVTKDGAVAAPGNIFDAGWYNASAKPGEKGAMLIDGHVHGPTKPGIFIGLKKLKAGDEITVERGDGQVLTYEVISTKTYPADNVDMGAALSPVKNGKPGLNLITCAGELDKNTNQYKDRLVVFAAQK